MTTQHIIEGCKANKEQYQRALYDCFADQLMNISLRYARDQHEARDVLQNAFIKIFTNIKEFRIGEGSFEGWLSRITVNEALMLYRKNRRIFYSDDDTKFFEQEIDAQILLDLDAQDVLNLLDELPDGYRVVFNLYVVEGYDHREIGEILGITASSSRSQLTRAKQMLRKMFDQKKHLAMRDDINRELKNKLRSHRTEWDKEALWADIKPNLPQKERKRKAVFFWWILPSILFLITVFCFFTSENIIPNKAKKAIIEKDDTYLPEDKNVGAEIQEENISEIPEQSIVAKIATGDKIIIEDLQPFKTNIKKERNLNPINRTAVSKQNSSIITPVPSRKKDKNLSDNSQREIIKEKESVPNLLQENLSTTLLKPLSPLSFALTNEEDNPRLSLSGKFSAKNAIKWVFLQEATVGIGRPFRTLESEVPGAASSLMKKENEEEILEGWNARILLGAKHKSGVFVKTGFDYTQFNERFSGENLLVEEFQVVNDSAIVANFSGGVYTPDTVTATQTQTRFVTQYNQHRFYNIPFVVGFEKIKGNLGFNVYLGASFNVQYDFSGRFNDFAGNLMGDEEIAESGHFNNSVGASYLAGGQLVYHLNEHLGFSGGVEFQHNPNSVASGSTGFSQRYNFLNLNLGVRRTF